MKRYQCSEPGCGLRYCSAYTLKRHVETIHFQLYRFECSVCARYFSYKHALKQHFQRHKLRKDREKMQKSGEKIEFCHNREAFGEKMEDLRLPEISVCRQGAVVLPSLFSLGY